MEICDWWFIVKVNNFPADFFHPELTIMAGLLEIAGRIRHSLFFSSKFFPLFKTDRSNQQAIIKYFQNSSRLPD
jgi:hypothetical protein